jgi:hypothetical protein
MNTLKEINLKLAEQSAPDPNFYPPAERAGFNFGKAVCSMIETFNVDEIAFIRGILKPIITRQKFIERNHEKNRKSNAGTLDKPIL